MAENPTPAASRRRTPDGVARVGHILVGVSAAPAARLFAGVWTAAALALVMSGHGFPWFGLVLLATYLPLSLATVAITADPARASGAGGRGRLVAHVGLILLFIVLTGWGGLAFHGVVGPDASIPLWSPFIDALHGAGGRWFGQDNYVANPVTYVALPLLALLLAGARLPGLGFRRGHRVGPVLVLWSVLPLGSFLLSLAAGTPTVGHLAGRLLSNAMQNGFWEEFLFRGALQTRLRRLWGPGWALVTQALAFGAWHLGLGFANTGHTGLVPALASVLVHQAVIGLALGVIFERTRNLVAPSIVHVLVNSLG